MKGRRSRFAVFACVGTTLALLATACSSGSSSGGASHSSAKNASPIVVGYEVPLTGLFAANGADEVDGFKLGLSKFGGSVDGHKIVVQYDNTQANPAIALTDAQSLVQNQHVNLIEGPLAANEISAVTPYLGTNNVPVDDLSYCGYLQYTDYQQYGNGIASGWGCDQPAMMGAEWAAKVMHWTHVVTIGQDFSFGWEVVGGFKAAFTQEGGTIDKTIWVPNNATDLSSYISQIPPNTQAVFAEMSGSLAVNFTGAYQQFGLKGKIPVLGITQLTDYSVLPAENPTAILGDYTDAQYCDGIDSPANNAFTALYHKTYGTYPGYYSESAYVKAEILNSALKSLGGNASNPKAVAKAIRAVNIQAPRGPVTIDPKTWSTTENMYICKVESVNGTLRNVPVKTYPNVKPWGPLSFSTWLAHFKADSLGRPS